MTKLKAHIGFKISLVILIIALLVPSFVKLAHAFETHKHEICKTPQKSHYHELNLDCDFYKFKLSNAYYSQHYSLELIAKSPFNLVSKRYNSAYSNLQLQQTSLRGPPQLI
jgi:cell division protein FtsL